MHESMLQRRSKNAYIRNQEFLITLKIDLKIWNLQQGLIGFESFLIKGELPLQISTMLPGTSLSEKDRSEIFLFGRSCTKIKKELFSMTMSKARAASQVRKWQTFPRKFMLICMKCAFCSYCQSIWAMRWIYPHNTRTQIWEYQQGGRTWQAFGRGKNGHETFRQARIYNLSTNASFLRIISNFRI